MQKIIKVLEGKLIWYRGTWDDDPPNGWQVDGEQVAFFLDDFKDKNIRITIEEIPWGEEDA